MKTRKEQIKTIAIIFLAIMLVLTFFSNSIMNYSLVEVSTEAIVSDKLTSRVRGSGMVEAKEAYSVVVKHPRKIKTMDVRLDQEVHTGDVLFTLDEGDSTELRTAKKNLLQAEADYEISLLTSSITVEQRKQIESGKLGSLTDRQNLITQLKTNADNANNYLEQVTLLSDQLAAVAVSNDEEIKSQQEAKNLAAYEVEKDKAADAVKSAEADLEKAKQPITDAEAAVTEAEEVKKVADATGDAAKISEADAALKAARDGLYKTKTDSDLQKEIDEKKQILDEATAVSSDAINKYNNASYNSKINGYNQAIAKLEASDADATKKAEMTQTLNLAKKNADDAKEELDKAADLMKNQITYVLAYENILELRKEVEELEKETVEPEVKAPINGIVTEIMYTAGQTPEESATVLMIKPENKAYTISFSVTQAQAAKIKVGDQADIINNWSSRDITAKVYKITRDKDNKQNSIITCELDGNVDINDTYTLSIGQNTSNYDYIVPTSAIREDSNGKFIYVVESKSTPLGNRYYARRCDIEIITEDDSRTAITGPSEDAYVITTTSKPIEANQQVRLAD
ncbi:MAG: HlyD family efflux transporter periplasmic adaptor subunit [Pseudobutyrivibrio sp.]|nr:HlyD family efflux transporter periplasmic adaptor subunit [Pseudobutyrivibrio sp.]